MGVGPCVPGGAQMSVLFFIQQISAPDSVTGLVPGPGQSVRGPCPWEACGVLGQTDIQMDTQKMMKWRKSLECCEGIKRHQGSPPG